MQRAVYLFMRDGAALVALRYPILTLDERQLTPALGYIFNVRWLLPGESIVSILWKFARANGLLSTLSFICWARTWMRTRVWRPCGTSLISGTLLAC